MFPHPAHSETPPHMILLAEAGHIEEEKSSLGAFSNCICKQCMDEARTEVEKRLGDESVTACYIKRLEMLVRNLRVENDHLEKYQPNGFVRPESPDSFGMIDSAERNVKDTDAPAPGVDEPKLQIKRLKKVLSQYGDETIEKDFDVGSSESRTKSLGSESVLTVFRHFDKKFNFWRRSIEILSPAFVDVLRQISDYDIDISLVDDVLTLTEPLMLLFHHRKHLAKYLAEADENSEDAVTAQARAHTKLILDYMLTEFDGVNRTLDDLESAQPSGLITFPDIWLLYPPGTVVYTTDNGEHEALMVDSVRGVAKSHRGRSGKQVHDRLELTCWSINYDGEIFGREWSTHIIAPFHGIKEIASLDLVPERFLPDAENVKEFLTVRGHDFWALQGQNYREYTGEIWSQHMSEESIRVMVDHLTYQRRMDWPIRLNAKNGPSDALSKNWRCNKFASQGHDNDFNLCGDPRGRRLPRPPPRPRSYRGYSPDREWDEPYEEPYRRYRCERPPFRGDSMFNMYDALEPDAEPDELALLLCPQHVQGYCLRDKIWKSLNVTQLKPVTFRKNAWDRLVLDPQYKDIVQAMVASYVDKTAGLEDLVAGKGAGLVALLHGPPGTGKTLTAECVADSFEKPLYQVTCGDIGTNPERLEQRLEEIFDYAVTWGAILLLDEADVFLQDRDYENLQRNALVSIFLRTLEYFNGILFLTTNRVGTFDQAFQSRIHVTLGLPQLDRPRRIEVWSIFIHDLARQSRITAAQRDALDRLVADRWSREPLNGRQIRNSVRTAMLIAEKKKQRLGQQHFETVLRIGKEFSSYMSALQKGEAEEVAEGKGDRLADLGGFQEVEKP
ncbi:hypothetical protein MMC07_002077 [Pseudocyphellaria aurata]|nr:hypothetical protein [Pseudocyphellaria aurata]